MLKFTKSKCPTKHAEKSAKALKLIWKQHSKGINFKFNEKIYGNREVKNKLKQLQKNKCAYCGVDFTRSYGEVEHYRPKAGWKQRDSDNLNQPGYFWLVYDWDNLLVSCQMCNNLAHKGSLFPLLNPSKRSTPASIDILKEKPALINPFIDDPSTYIEWNKDVPRPVRGSRRGRVTIKVFGLVTDAVLVDVRRSAYIDVELLVKAAEALPNNGRLRKNLAKRLRLKLSPETEFSTMLNANFKSRILAL